MPRYIKQKLRFDCVPTVVINIGKWLGLPITRKNDYNKIKKGTKCINGFENGKAQYIVGSSALYMMRYVRKIFNKKMDFVLLDKPTIPEARKLLQNGHALLVSFAHQVDGRHITIFTDIETDCWYKKNDCWIGHNFYSDEATSYITSEIMRKVFYNKYGTPLVWCLTKKGNK